MASWRRLEVAIQAGDTLANRQFHLSPLELRSIITHPSNPTEPFNHFYLYLEIGLERELIDPDRLLVQVLDVLGDGDDRMREQALRVFALALRFGANPNLYLKTIQGQRVHILDYLHRGSPGLPQDLLNSLTVMLLRMRSNPSSVIGSTRNDNTTTDLPTQTNQLPEILDKIERGLIEPKTLTRIGTLLDQANLVKTEPDLEELMMLRNRDRIETIIYRSGPDRRLRALEWAVRYLSSSSFKLLVMAGVQPDYPTRHRIIMGALQSKGPIQQELQEMLVSMVQAGLSLDQAQTELLARTREQDLWKRLQTCDRFDLTPDQLRRIGTFAPIYSQERMCQDQVLGPERKDRMVFRTLTGWPIDGTQFQGWHFDCHLFNHLMETSKNPYDGGELPEWFLRQLQPQRRFVRLLGLIDERTQPRNHHELRSKPQIQLTDDAGSKRARNRFVKLALFHGLSRDRIAKLSGADLEAALQTLDRKRPDSGDQPIDRLSELPPQQAVTLFMKYVRKRFRHDPETITRIMNLLKT